MAAWAVDIAVDYASKVDGIVTAAELGGIVRSLATDYDAEKLQGNIAGAALLGLNGDCASKPHEINALTKET